MGPINKPGDYLKFSNDNPKVINNYYAYKYLERRRRYLKRMHSNLMKYDYEESYYPEEGIRKVIFTPTNYKDVPAYYQELISVVTEYFSCRAVWVKRFPKQTIDPIHTFIIIGHVPDVYLCSKFLWYEINNIQELHFNRIKLHRKHVKKSHKRRKKNLKGNARTITRKYIKKLLYNISRVWERLLEDKGFNINEDVKRFKINQYLRENKLVDFGKREWKTEPWIQHAYCRPNKFMRNKIIVYKKLTPYVD